MSSIITIQEVINSVVIDDEQSTIVISSDSGPQGAAGVGVPVGGTAGQVLAKIDGTNYNTQWVNQSGGGVVGDDIYSTTGTYPDRTKTFPQIVADMNKVLDYHFGTSTPPSGAIAINNAAALGTHFNPLQDGTGAIVINREYQRYPANFTSFPSTLEFTPNGLNMKAEFNDGVPPVLTASPTANVVYSRQVTIPDASLIQIGQVVGLGAESYDNAHTLWTCSVASAVAGDVLTLVLSHVKTAAQGGFDPITITSFTSLGGDDAALANDMVSKINANATLQFWKITAYKMPGVVGGFAFTAPRNSLTKTDNFGTDGKGSLSWLTRTFSRTGSAVVLTPQNCFAMTYVVSKSGNTLTLSNPVNVTTSSVLTFNATRMMEVAVTGGSTTYTFSDVNGITAGQTVQCSYQDSNIRRITNVNTGTNTITLEASVFMQAGHFLAVYPVIRAITTASTTASNILTFGGGVPAGVVTGQQILNYFGTNSGIIKVVSKDATTVTLSQNVTCSSGDTFLFHASIVSPQFWSKWCVMPQADNRTIIATEMVCTHPNASVIAAWGAKWLYGANSDPNPIGSVLPLSEIDDLEGFTYWNNASSNDIVMNPVSPATTIQADTGSTGNRLQGNNLGAFERKIGLVWTYNRVYFYVDDVLMFARISTWNLYKRAQMGVNLAIGSSSTSFNSNGFYPIDQSVFPAVFNIKSIKVYASPSSAVPPQVL